MWIGIEDHIQDEMQALSEWQRPILEKLIFRWLFNRRKEHREANSRYFKSHKPACLAYKRLYRRKQRELSKSDPILREKLLSRKRAEYARAKLRKAALKAALRKDD